MSASDRRFLSSVPAGLLLAGLLVGVTACGKKGPPIPPEPRGPGAPTRVAVHQIGAEVLVTFERPQAKGDRPAQEPVAARLLRVAWPPGPAPPADTQAFRRRGEPVARTLLEALAPGDTVRLVDDTLVDLDHRGTGWTLRYAIQVEDARGRVSPPAPLPELVPLAPASPPRNLTAEPTADGIRLGWDTPERLPDPPDAADPQPPAYHVYRATPGEPFPTRPLSPGPLTDREYLDGTAVAGESYAYSVRVVLAPGRPAREGEPSATVVIEARDTFAPATPEGLVAVQEGDAVRLFWNPNRESDLAGYRVYRRVEDGTWTRIGPDPIESPTFIDRDVAPGSTVAYRVSAVDRASTVNESEPTAERELVVAADSGGAP